VCSLHERIDDSIVSRRCRNSLVAHVTTGFVGKSRALAGVDQPVDFVG